MTKHVELRRANGKYLRGYLALPEGANKIVVMFHGFTGNKTEHNGHFRNFARILEKKNVASIRMDYYGNGESDGEFYEFTYDAAVEDANLIIDFAKNIEGITSVILLGFSFGGMLAANIANENNCDKLVLMSPAGNMPEIARNCYKNWKKLDNGNVYNCGFEMSYDLVESLDKIDVFKNAKNYNRKVLIVQGVNDLAVPNEYGKKYASIFKNVEYHWIENCGHGYDFIENTQEAYKYIIDFITKK